MVTEPEAAMAPDSAKVTLPLLVATVMTVAMSASSVVGVPPMRSSWPDRMKSMPGGSVPPVMLEGTPPLMVPSKAFAATPTVRVCAPEVG